MNDNLSLREYRSIRRLKDKWNDIYVKGSYTPFSTYEYNRICRIAFFLRKKHWKFRCRFICFEEDGKCGIWALLIDDTLKTIYNISHDSPMDYYEVMSNTDDVVFAKKCFERLKEKYQGYDLCLENIKENSTIKSILPANIDAEPCVHIDLNNYNNWYNNLSKHQRQNIRTAYNRIRKDEIELRLEHYSAEKGNPSVVDWFKCMLMYENRSIDKLYKNGGSVSRLGRLNRYKNMLFAASNNSLMKLPSRLVFVLYVRKEPVAYLGGFYDEKKSVFYVGRLCCSNKWLKYDMGIVLLDKVIKELTREEKDCCLDLTRGDEPYKYAMGGVTHYNYCYKVSCN